MPFVEIGDIYKEWGRISETSISLSKILRDKYFGSGENVRVFFDKDNNLIGLEPDNTGYKFRNEKFTIRSLKHMDIARGRFEAYRNEELKLVVIDLNKPIATV